MNPFATKKSSLEAIMHIVAIGLIVVGLVAITQRKEYISYFPYIIVVSALYLYAVWRFFKGTASPKMITGMRITAAIIFVVGITAVAALTQLALPCDADFEGKCQPATALWTLNLVFGGPGFLLVAFACFLMGRELFVKAPPAAKPAAVSPPLPPITPAGLPPTPTGANPIVAPVAEDDIPLPPPPGPKIGFLLFLTALAPIIAQIAAVPFNPSGWASSYPAVGWMIALFLIVNPIGAAVAIILLIGLANRATRMATAVLLFIASLVWSVIVFQMVQRADDQEFTG